MRRARWKRESFFSFRLRTPYFYGEAGIRYPLRRPIRENTNQLSPPRSITLSTAKLVPLRRSGAKGASRVEWERFQRATRLAALPRERPRGSRFAEPNVVLRGGERHFDYQLIGRRNHVSGYRGIGRSRAFAKSN